MVKQIVKIFAFVDAVQSTSKRIHGKKFKTIFGWATVGMREMNHLAKYWMHYISLKSHVFNFKKTNLNLYMNKQSCVDIFLIFLK